MSTIFRITVLVCYLSLVLELTLLHVPSIASFRSIWIANEADVCLYSDKYRGLFRLGKTVKLILFLPPLLTVYAVFLYPLSTVFIPTYQPFTPLYEPGPVTLTAAVVLAIVVRVITVSSVVSLDGIRKSTEGEGLQTSGLFVHSRNPGLVGMFVMFAGFWVALPSPIFLVGILFYVVYMDFKVRMEEDFLANKFGAEFQTYRKKTSRYLA